MSEWFPAIREVLEKRGIPLPRPYPHTWQTLFGSMLAALIVWAVMGAGYLTYFLVHTTVYTVTNTAEIMSHSVSATIHTALTSSHPEPDADGSKKAEYPPAPEPASGSGQKTVPGTEPVPPPVPTSETKSNIPVTPAIPLGPVSIREAIHKSPLPFRETVDLSLTDAAKQTDFAVLQAVLRLKLGQGRCHLLTSQYHTKGNDSWHLQRIRLYIPMTTEAFLTALEESLEVWAERAVLTREGADKIVLSVEDVRTHEIWLTQTGENFPLSPTGDGPRLTIVIDDLGGNMHAAETLIRLDIPITFAIWPFAAKAAETARAAHQADREILIHQPMQPMQSPFLKAGPGELTLSLSPEDIRKNINQSIASVPYAVGMNNHMGSRITQDAASGKYISETLAASGLFVLDSVTHPKSVFYDAARQQGLPAYRRAVFLDDGPRTEQSVLAELKKAEEIARKTGQAVAIGHPHPETLAALKTWAVTRDPTVTLVPLRYLSVPLEML